MTIRELIIQKRTECGMTQKELSEKTGISQNRISEFESGNRNMNSDNIDKIFAALDIFFKQSKEQQWDFAKECAKILKSKDVSKIDNLSQEEVATLTGKNEILEMKEYDDELYSYLDVKGVADKNAYNFMKTLINFHLALLK